MWFFGLARAWIFISHAIAIAFAFGVAALHFYLIREPLVGDPVARIQPSIPSLYLPTAVIASIGALGHLILFARGLVRTGFPDVSVRPMTSPHIVNVHGQDGCGRIVVIAENAGGSWSLMKTQVVRHTMKIHGVWNRYNAEITRIFILSEIVLQTFQANKMSQLIASKWINRLVAVVIISNCWFSPVLHYFLGARPKAYVRLARLLVDSCLDMVYCIGIPLTIFYPYYRDFIGGMSVFSPFLYFTDTWYTNAVSELLQVSITSWIDLLSKFTGIFTLMYRLHTIRKAVGVVQQEARLHASHARPSLVDAVPAVKSRLSRMLDAILIAWGVTVLALHAHASVTSFLNHNVGCLLELQPWGARFYTCVALEVSCSQLHNSGDRHNLTLVIRSVNQASVKILIISNCPALQVPPAVQDLTNLLTIKIYNSTVSEWGEDAALTNMHHPRLQNLYFSRLDMPSIPPGLVSVDFPPIWDIVFCKSNVVHFPDSIIGSWRNVILLVNEGNTALTEIPRSVIDLPQLTMVGLRNNAIESILDHALDAMALRMLDLAGNPLKEIPESVGKGLGHMPLLFDIRATRVTELPASWSQPSNLTRLPIELDARNTPLCDSRATWNATTMPWLTVDCSSVADAAVSLAYPLEDEDRWRRENQ